MTKKMSKDDYIAQLEAEIQDLVSEKSSDFEEEDAHIRK